LKGNPDINLQEARLKPGQACIQVKPILRSTMAGAGAQQPLPQHREIAAPAGIQPTEAGPPG